MNKWRVTTIGACSTILGDGLHGTPKYTSNGEYAFINGNNLRDGKIVIKADTKRVDEDEYKKYKKDLNERTVLVSINGTLGNVATYNGEKVILGKSACYFNVIESCDVTFMKYVVSSPQFQQYLQSVATGTTIKNVSLKQMREYEFLIPDLEIQRKIAATLKNLDDKIALNNEINNNLEQQIQALFIAWFVNFIPFSGKIPDDWKNIPFSDFLVQSKEKSDNPNIPMYSVTDTGIFPRSEKFKKVLSMTRAKNKVIRQTDLVFGMSREILNWGIMRDPEGRVSSAYNVYHVDRSINSFYLESYIKSNISLFKDLIKPASREGQGIDKVALMQKTLLLPSKETLDKYYEMESVYTSIMKQLQAENKTLTEIRDELLPKLMSGEIDVEDVKI